MIKSVFTSFFRTIGRILAYLVVGGLIAFIMAKINQNKPIIKSQVVSEVLVLWEN